jgi:hypothetical protein
MRTRQIVGLCSLVLATTSLAAESPSANDRSQVEAAALLVLAGERSPEPYIIVNLPSTEVAAIKKQAPSLNNLMSEKEFYSKFRNPKQRPGYFALTVEIVKLTQRDAVVLAGTPFVSLSGSRDRFVLRKVRGHWRIISREKDYEISVRADKIHCAMASIRGRLPFADCHFEIFNFTVSVSASLI